MPGREGSDLLERLYHEHAAGLLGFLVYRTGDRALAEDVLADTFERVLTTRRGWRRGRASEKTWLYTIALNRLRDLARRKGAEIRALERVAVPAGGVPLEADGIEHRDLVRRAIGCLSDEEHEAVALRFGADLSLREVAELLGEPQTTVEGRVYRALRRLRDDLA
jgi:RNA polymerase sigma-70 factor, ECF subfamily